MAIAVGGGEGGTPDYLKQYLTILMRKYTEGGEGMDLLDVQRYTRVLDGLSPEQIKELTQMMDETHRYRPDVAQVAEIKNHLFPGSGKRIIQTLPPAQIAAYTPIRENPYYLGSKSVYGAQGLIEGTQGDNQPGLEKLGEIVQSLGSRMTRKEKSQASLLRQETVKAARGHKGRRADGGTEEEYIVSDDLAQRKREALRAQTALLQQEVGADESQTA